MQIQHSNGTETLIYKRISWLFWYKPHTRDRPNSSQQSSWLDISCDRVVDTVHSSSLMHCPPCDISNSRHPTLCTAQHNI